MENFDRTHIQVIGAEENFGESCRTVGSNGPHDVALWMSVHHPEKKALEIWAREIASSGTGMAPGTIQD